MRDLVYAIAMRSIRRVWGAVLCAVVIGAVGCGEGATAPESVSQEAAAEGAKVFGSIILSGGVSASFISMAEAKNPANAVWSSNTTTIWKEEHNNCGYSITETVYTPPVEVSTSGGDQDSVPQNSVPMYDVGPLHIVVADESFDISANSHIDSVPYPYINYAYFSGLAQNTLATVTIPSFSTAEATIQETTFSAMTPPAVHVEADVPKEASALTVAQLLDATLAVDADGEAQTVFLFSGESAGTSAPRNHSVTCVVNASPTTFGSFLDAGLLAKTIEGLQDLNVSVMVRRPVQEIRNGDLYLQINSTASYQINVDL